MVYTAYKIRWLLLIIECSAISMRRFVSKSFGVINNVVADYFDVEHSQVDVLGTVDNVSAVIFGFILLLLGGRFRLRTMMLIKAFFMFLSVTICTIGFLSKNFYWIIFIGRILTGIPEALLYVIPTMLVANWFPQNELAIAFNIPLVVSHTSAALVGILFPFLLTGRKITLIEKTSNQSIVLLTMQTLFENHTVEPGNITRIAEVEEYAKLKLVSIFGCASLFMLLAFILTLIFCKDHPPTPPSASQDNILEMRKRNSDNNHEGLNFRYLCDEVNELFHIPQFLLIVSAIFFKASSSFTAILGPSFLLQSFPKLDNRTPGILLVVSSLAAALGAVISGKILDKYKRPKIVTTISVLINTLAALGMYFGHLYKSLITIFIAYILDYLCDSIVFAGSSEFLLETTYPRNKLILGMFYYSSYNIGVFIYNVLDRWLQEKTNETWAVFVYIIVNLQTLLLYQIAKPAYKRSHVDGNEQC